MSVFQYQEYRNPYGPSIAEALAHQADPQAAAALRTGDIQAQALARQSALRGQLFTQLGAIPGEIQAQQDAAQKRAAQQQQLQIGAQTLQENQLTLADRQAKRDAEARIGQLIASTPRGPDGTYPISDIVAQLPGAAIPFADPYIQHLTAYNTARTAETTQRVGKMQTSAAALYQAGAPYLPTYSLIENARHDRVLSDAAADDLQQQLAESGDPKSVLKQVIGYQKPITKKEDEALVNPATFETVMPATPKPDKPTEASLAVDAAKGDPMAAAALNRLKPPPDDQVIAGLFGKQATGQTLTASETALLEGWKAKEGTKPTTVKFMLNGKPVEQTMTTTEAMKLGAVSTIPPASVQVLNQTMQGGQQVTDTAKAIAEYRVAPPSSRSLATPAGEMLMTQVMAANPAYDATQFPTRQKMRQAFTSGPQSQTINSLNTAIGHLDQFTEVVKALDNGNFQPGNQAYNWLRTTFGQSAPTNFAGIRSIMSGELAAAFKKSGATDQEIASVEQAIASKNSTGQLLDYVQTIALPALGSKVVSFDQQYRQVMGASDPFQILLPESAGILQKYGIDPAHPTMGARPPTGTAPAPSVNPFRR